MNLAEINEIRRLLSEFKSDKFIIEHLNIPHRTYYRYKKKIYKEDNKQLADEASISRQHHKMQVRRALEYCIQINKEICDDKNSSAQDKRESSIIIPKAYAALAEVEEFGPIHISAKTIKEVTDNSIKRLS